MKNTARILVLSLVSIIGLSSGVSGKTITKTFEIGEKTQQPFSHRRVFEIPCNTTVSGEVYFSRLSGSTVNVPLTFTLMEPAADGGEGEVVETKQATATTSLKSISFSSRISAFGCNKTWSVRVRTDEFRSGFTVKGEIRLNFNDSRYPATLEKLTDAVLEGWLLAGQSVDYSIFFRNRSSKNPQGQIIIEGSWNHTWGLLPIKMKAILKDPRGNEVASATGFSKTERNPCCYSNKLKLEYLFREHIPGTWTLTMKNMETSSDALDITLNVSVSAFCPQF